MSVILKFSVHRGTDRAPEHLIRHIEDLRSWRDYYIEAPTQPTDGQLAALAGLIADPVTEQVEINEALVPGSQVQVAYKRGIVDNENDSLVALAALAEIEAVAARVAHTYASSSKELAAVIGSQACNNTIEELHHTEPHYDSLLPHGEYAPAEHHDLRSMTDDELLALGTAGGRVLDLGKMRCVRDIQFACGLETVSDVMLESLDARWSDHCAHTTWKSLGNLLGKLINAARATANPNIVSMFRDNAGIWDFYDGYGIAIKAETHNGPSAVSAYFGQLTKLGGVLRDILGTGLGADPIGSFEYTATGLPDSPSPIAGRPGAKQIANETIRAIKEYGNTFGVPMMWSHMTFHPSYRAKPFALGGSIGLIPNEHAQKGRAEPGDHAVLIGGLTGNDGIHGATGASTGAVMDATSVQIGSPLEEIKFREAILELRDGGLIRAITDLGAAGLNSAFGEMGEDVGAWINTALVPLKTGGLPMWRILLSESQERMALAIAPEHWNAARRILERHEVRNTVIGRFTGDNRYRVVHDFAFSEENVIAADGLNMANTGEVGLDVSYELLDYVPPQISAEPPRQEWHSESKWPSISALELAALTPQLLADYELADQSIASLQYDSSVQARSWYGPNVGARRVPTGFHASRPVYGSNAAAVFNVAFNPWLFEAHPVLAARQTFLSALTAQVLAGVAVTDVCMTDNFYTPDMAPGANGWLVAMVNELAALSEQFRVPFISGKDSSAGSTVTDEGVVSVPPAVFISALGKAPDIKTLRYETLSGAQNLLVRVGLWTPSLAGTIASRLLDCDANDVDEVHPQTAFTFLDHLSRVSCTDAPSGRVVGAGGVLATAILDALAADVSIELNVPADGCEQLLAEHRCSALIEVPESRLNAIPADLGPLVVGRVTGTKHASVKVDGVEVLTPEALRAWSSSYEEALA